MKIFSHWRLATTISVILIASIIIALPAISVLRFPLGATFFSVAIFAGACSIATTIWLYRFQCRELIVSKADAGALLKSVPLIFFTLDKKMQLSRFSSTQFDSFFNGKNFTEGTDFANIVGFLADSQARGLACDYVQLMLEQSKSAVASTNPLECAAALMLNSEGRPEHRYFKFAFTDHVENGQFAGILVAIYDISDACNLSAQLQALTQKSNQSSQSSVDLLVRMLQIDRNTLVEKFLSFENLLDEANLDLKDSGLSGYQTLADRVHKKIKLLRNEAVELGFTEFGMAAATMATELESLAQKSELSGNDFFTVAFKLDELYDCLHKLSALLRQLPIAAHVPVQTDAPWPEQEKYAEQTPQVATEHVEAVREPIEPNQHSTPAGFASTTQTPAPPTNAISILPSQSPAIPAKVINSTVRFEFALIQQACIRTAEKLGKKLAVRAQNLSADAVPDRLKQPLTEILVQLIRSSLANGLELPAVRAAAGKEETGTLSMTWTELTDKSYELVFRDDGCGINFELIRARALALNRLSSAQAEALELRQLVGYIFEPGFSSAIKTGDNSGFGVGLDLVMATAKRAGGKISVGTQTGLYTQFRVSFPAL